MNNDNFILFHKINNISNNNQVIQMLPQYPCCSCSNKIHKINIRKLIHYELQLFIFHINHKLTLNYEFVMGIKCKNPFTDNQSLATSNTIITARYSKMMYAIYKLLLYFYQKNPYKVNISKVQNFNDISPILIKEMDNIMTIYNKAAENTFELITGKTINQRLVIDIFLFATKFMSQCIDKLKTDDKIKIFYNVVETIHKFFKEKNINIWITHTIQVMDPFGKVIIDKKPKE